MAKNSQRKQLQDNPDDLDEVDAEDLINEVQLHDVIYNKKNKSHARITCTEAAWVKIADAVGSTPQKCQKKWNNLRRCFRDGIGKENLPSGSGAPRGRKKFPFMAQMEFLREHMLKKSLSHNLVRGKTGVIEIQTGPQPSITRAKSGNLLVIAGQ